LSFVKLLSISLIISWIHGFTLYQVILLYPV
jgi:hypothetical protein